MTGQYISTEEAASIFDVPVPTFLNWHRKNMITVRRHKDGRKFLWDHRDIQVLLRERYGYPRENYLSIEEVMDLTGVRSKAVLRVNIEEKRIPAPDHDGITGRVKFWRKDSFLNYLTKREIPDPRYLTTAEAAKILRVSPSTLIRYVTKNGLNIPRHGKNKWVKQSIIQLAKDFVGYPTDQYWTSLQIIQNTQVRDLVQFNYFKSVNIIPEPDFMGLLKHNHVWHKDNIVSALSEL